MLITSFYTFIAAANKTFYLKKLEKIRVCKFSESRINKFIAFNCLISYRQMPSVFSVESLLDLHEVPSPYSVNNEGLNLASLNLIF